MRPILPLLLIAAHLSTSAAAQTLRPTVVELYTSQGCSSCPPADALLTKLQADPALLVLDFHVTYWDRLGWKDPFSLPAATARQKQFAAALGLDTIYTPQIVVDGHEQAIGSDRLAVEEAIAHARAQSNSVVLSLTAGGAGLHLRAGAGQGTGALLLVGFDRSHTTPVRAGENGGRTLAEVNVVRGIEPAAAWSGQPVDLVAPRPAGERVAVLLQGADGRILGAAVLP